MSHLPISLQYAIANAHRHLRHSDQSNRARGNLSAIEQFDDLHTIGRLFGSLSDLPLHYTARHARRFLLVLLSLRTLVPYWYRLQPYDQSFNKHICSLSQVVVRSVPIATQQEIIEAVWEWCEPTQPLASFQETTRLSVYTLMKVLTTITTSYTDYGHQPDVHADVALQLIGQAYASYPHSTPHRSEQFWEYWLTHIVPAAWVPLSSDPQT